MAAFYLIPVQIPFHLKALVGASPAQAGMAIAASTLASAMISPMFPRVRARLSHPGVLALSLAVAGAGLVLVSLAGAYWQVLVGLAVTGTGLGIHFPNISTWLMAVSPDHLRGRLLGGMTTALFLGQFLSPVMGEALNHTVGTGAGFGVAGVTLGLVAAIVAVTQLRRARSVAPVGT
jgi:MFS family permease